MAFWPLQAPAPAVSAPAEVPQALLDQLAPDGRIVIPVGGAAMQELLLLQKTDKGLTQERLELVNFVPLVRDSF